MPETTSKGCPMPTTKQIEVFEMGIDAYRKSDAIIETAMDDDGTMLLFVYDDGARSYARFDRDGKIMGDWIW